MNSALHGLVPCSNKFAIRLLQNCICPLSSVSDLMRNGKTQFSSGLSVTFAQILHSDGA